MSYHYYLKFSPEILDENDEDLIPILSFNFVDDHGTRGPEGKFERESGGRSSLQIQHAYAAGRLFDEVTLTASETENGEPVYSRTMFQALISSYTAMSAPADDGLLRESFSLRYTNRDPRPHPIGGNVPGGNG